MEWNGLVLTDVGEVVELAVEVKIGGVVNRVHAGERGVGITDGGLGVAFEGVSLETLRQVPL